MDARLAQCGLILFVESQPQKLSIFNCPGLRELIALCGPLTHKCCSSFSNFLCQKKNSIEKGIRVADLIAQSKDGDSFACQVDLVKLFEDCFPIALQLTPIPGGDAQNQLIEVGEFFEIIFRNVQQFHRLLMR